MLGFFLLYMVTMKLNDIILEFQNGDSQNAYNLIKKYIKSNPKDLIAIYNFAYMSELLQKKNIAIENYKYVNNNNKLNWKSRFNLYLIYIKDEKFNKALKLINEVLILNPNYQPALRDKALVEYKLNKYNDALQNILKANKINEKDYIGLNILGLIYSALEENIKAKQIFEKTILLNSKYAPSYNNYGNCLQKLGEIDLALNNFIKAFKLNTKFEEAINNIGNIYIIKGKYKEAIVLYKNALKKGGNIAKIYYNIGIAYSYLKNYKKTKEYYNKSFDLNPNDQILRKNYSIFYLSQQEYKKAWELYDARLNVEDFQYKNRNLQNVKNKLWMGEKIDSKKKILVIKEQGIGDEILFSSMYPDLLKKHPNCAIETDSRLLSLFKRSFKYEKNFVPYLSYSNDTNSLNQFDKIIYAGSLGRIFRNSIKNFPGSFFLSPKNNILKQIKKQLTDISVKPKIGISWKSKRMVYGEDKSINLNILEPIISIDDFDFINLQYGETKEEINKFKKNTNYKIHTFSDIDLFNDFESIAALLKNLNLFITVSNSTAHLAGALGVPTLLIKPKNHAVFFYWNINKNKTPWYSSVKLFEFNDNWKNTINNIKKELLLNIKLTI